MQTLATAHNQRRATDEIKDYWGQANPDVNVPRLSEISIQSSPRPDNHFLLRRDSRSDHLVVIVCGSSAARLFQKAPKETGLADTRAPGLHSHFPVGESLSDVTPPGLKGQFFASCKIAACDMTPRNSDGVFDREDGRTIKFRSVFLPVNSNCSDDTYVFGAVSSTLEREVNQVDQTLNRTRFAGGSSA